MPRIRLLPEIRRGVWRLGMLEGSSLDFLQSPPCVNPTSLSIQAPLRRRNGFCPHCHCHHCQHQKGTWRVLELQWLACIVLLQRRYFLIHDIQMGNTRAKWLSQEKHFPPSLMRGPTPVSCHLTSTHFLGHVPVHKFRQDTHPNVQVNVKKNYF